MARHISDLSDPDSNWLALSGPDGWLFSENSLDLWEDWKRRRYVRLTLSADGVTQAFPM